MFKVGDKVIVCEKPPANAYHFSYGWISEMDSYCGKELKVVMITKDNYYYLDSNFYYHPSWIRLAIPVAPIVRITDMGML